MSFPHGGHLRQLASLSGRNPEEILDFSASINPLGPPESLRAVISRALEAIVHYPDPDSAELVAALAKSYGVCPEEVLVGNGSTEILYALARCLDRGRAVVPVPSYSDYVTAAELASLSVDKVVLKESRGFKIDWDELHGRLRGDEIVFLGRPNNPTGIGFDAEAFRRFAAEHPDTVFVVDEAFIEFVISKDVGWDNRNAGPPTRDTGGPALRLSHPTRQPNVIVLRSLTKFYAIPGLRLGTAIAGVDLAGRIRGQLLPWSVNALAQAVGIAGLEDTEYAEATREFVARQRENLTQRLSELPGPHVFPGEANFLLVRLDRDDIDARSLAARLLQDGIAIRVCENFDGLDARYFRLAVRTEEENDTLLASLARVLAPKRKAVPKKRRTPALMFQGTGSNAGKSVLTAALCRILLQDGVRVAPFKSQNMSLNSFVTRDGKEMGRAQVVQARACRLEPDVRMNPILLKPNSDTGCQVIVRGRPVGNMGVGTYIGHKPDAFDAARECYDSLADEFDAVVLEGAGSPAEVNLKHHDIVNMQMARHANSPVLLVGDIDRGGVFASFIGTMDTLCPWERALVAGFVINRFRGDASLLGPAVDYTLVYTGKPTFGIVPFVRDLGLPQEDSVEFKSGALDQSRTSSEAVEVAVVDLPHISNFTDFDALRIEKDVYLRVVRRAEELGSPDAVVLPGSKNVLGDLQYLRESGLAARLADLAHAGKTQIVGICGGFQILGRVILDPDRIESSAGEDAGLGLLEMATTLAREKTLARTRAEHLPSGHEVYGYEIHHGKTDAPTVQRVFQNGDAEVLGAAAADHGVWGTYLHGIFDADAFRRWFIDRLRERRGLEPVGGIRATYDIEPALDRLADIVRQSLDVNEIYRRMGL